MLTPEQGSRGRLSVVHLSSGWSALDLLPIPGQVAGGLTDRKALCTAPREFRGVLGKSRDGSVKAAVRVITLPGYEA